MNLLQRLQQIDEQEYEALRCDAHQELKKCAYSSDEDFERYILRTINELHNTLLAWRTRQKEKTIGSKHPISLRAQCPECGEGTLMLDSTQATATVVCSHCQEYDITE